MNFLRSVKEELMHVAQEYSIVLYNKIPFVPKKSSQQGGHMPMLYFHRVNGWVGKAGSNE